MMQEAFWRIVPEGEPIPDKPESNKVQAAQKSPGCQRFQLTLCAFMLLQSDFRRFLREFS